MVKPVYRGCTLGVKFRPGFDMKLLYDRPAKRQAWTEVEGVVSERARVVRLWDDV